MADDVAITAGSGTAIATDDAAGRHVQLFKLAYSADGVATLVQVDTDGVKANTELPAAAALSDTTANPTTPMTGSAGMLWDGTQWARAKSAAATVTGSLTAAGITPTALMVSVGNDAYSNVVAPATLGDGGPGTWLLSNVPFMWNGSSYDRVRGDATNGLHVDVTRLSALVAGTATVGAVNVKPATSGGLSPSANLIDVDETEDEIKATAGQVFGWYIFNSHATNAVYVKFYNATAANVTVGTTTPAFTLPIPASSAANLELTNGVAFSTAITIAATTGVAVADTGAPAANQVVATVFYA